MLKGSDFDMELNLVHVQPLKLGDAMQKPLGVAARRVIQNFITHGVHAVRTRKQGARPATTESDIFVWQTGLLFPAAHADSKMSRQCKDTVSKAIIRARKAFTPPTHLTHLLDIGKIRSHSGRHRSINDMKRSNVSKDVGKTNARIRDD